MSSTLSPADKAKLLAKQREMSTTTIDKKNQAILTDKTKSFIPFEKVEYYDDNDDYDCVKLDEAELGKKNAKDLLEEREKMI